MINENYIYVLMLAFALSIIIVMASIIIPIRLFNWKRWKGLVLGLVLQPIVCAILIICVFMGIVGSSKGICYGCRVHGADRFCKNGYADMVY